MELNYKRGTGTNELLLQEQSNLNSNARVSGELEIAKIR